MEISVRELKGIGEKTEKLLNRLNIKSVRQLVHHYPRCYITYPNPINISEIRSGQRCSVEAIIASPIHLTSGRKSKTCTCLIADESGQLFVRWFNMPYLRSSLHQGETWVFTGTPMFKEGRLMMEQPEFSKREKYKTQMETFQPVYPLTAGLSNKTLRKAQTEAFRIHQEEEYLPQEILSYYDLAGEETALKEIHFPTGPEKLMEAKKRIIFDEFFRFFCSLELVKNREEQALNEYIIPFGPPIEKFVSALPFPLTGAQKNALMDIRNDFSGTMAMNRLLQGDVGSGKTIVAVISMYAVVLAGFQAALMVPTEVLARQHYDTFCKMLSPFGIRISLLTGSTKAKEKKMVRQACETGEIDILIGTHAIIQDNVVFKNLAYIITDEQHRFGVKQRDAFMRKGRNPHVLVMSATPIPRTLGIILYRDLDVSIMNEMPAARLPVKNSVVGTSYRPAAWNFIRKQVALGHQAYVICPMIEENEELDLENVKEYSRMLSQTFPSSIRIEVLNGKMNTARKNEIMESFSRNEIQILVSTTVVEVGIDVPNATVMLIENAERFGLAQLHQLRGRVGRGKDQSYCIFLSGTDNEESMKRLSIIGHSNDGFEIANEDLKMRGPGEFFGTRQSGTMNFALGDIYSNADILKMASEAVDILKKEGYDFRKIPLYSLEEELNFAKDI
ncbi:MAG: ATP-dependent DNA helicase RecG [Eubacterium sp.]|nr:ATP-dependent DNA helicase RecG [Eubacterium sp.]MDD7208572.1 ATP-dependent DNA helicase RecG [Lachnospiraceae bacterium]MDY5497538.1 ATP-dependent DNA helicase RecG [Anaerobutyricum sp.]